MDEHASAFQILRGGLAESAATSRKEFVSAYITDTRLMGVVGLVVHWQLPENLSKDHFFQFFYMDAEIRNEEIRSYLMTLRYSKVICVTIR